jgi:hypothetical protein
MFFANHTKPVTLDLSPLACLIFASSSIKAAQVDQRTPRARGTRMSPKFRPHSLSSERMDVRTFTKQFPSTSTLPGFSTHGDIPPTRLQQRFSPTSFSHSSAVCATHCRLFLTTGTNSGGSWIMADGKLVNWRIELHLAVHQRLVGQGFPPYSANLLLYFVLSCHWSFWMAGDPFLLQFDGSLAILLVDFGILIPLMDTVLVSMVSASDWMNAELGCECLVVADLRPRRFQNLT